jgi:cytochrome b
LFRILWGFFGSTHARFASFVRGPTAAIAYLKALRRNEADRHWGHNPAGAWSVLAMLALLLVQAGTGLFSNDDIATGGPLAKLVGKAVSDRITSIHHLNVDLLYVLIALHLATVAYYYFGKRENLVKPMLTGFKVAAAGAGASDAVQTSGKIWLAALLLALCAGGVYALINYLAA